jgi:hypothetical protein
VASRGDGQKFGQALDDTHDDNLNQQREFHSECAANYKEAEAYHA